MSKLRRILLLSVGALLVLGYIGTKVWKQRTKRHSPAQTVTLRQEKLELEVRYCRPYKKGRPIFGTLVPYGEVWRTGANEASVFRTNEAIVFGDVPVPAGTYTLWSIPGQHEWKVVLNSKRYGWGVKRDGSASREAEHDVALATVPVGRTEGPVEQFTIRFKEDPLRMLLEWDDTRVEVPLGR